VAGSGTRGGGWRGDGRILLDKPPGAWYGALVVSVRFAGRSRSAGDMRPPELSAAVDAGGGVNLCWFWTPGRPNWGSLSSRSARSTSQSSNSSWAPEVSRDLWVTMDEEGSGTEEEICLKRKPTVSVWPVGPESLLLLFLLAPSVSPVWWRVEALSWSL